jgi:hypothetical protein
VCYRVERVEKDLKALIELKALKKRLNGLMGLKV